VKKQDQVVEFLTTECTRYRRERDHFEALNARLRSRVKQTSEKVKTNQKWKKVKKLNDHFEALNARLRSRVADLRKGKKNQKWKKVKKSKRRFEALNARLRSRVMQTSYVHILKSSLYRGFV
jgi:hypothetical protein